MVGNRFAKSSNTTGSNSGPDKCMPSHNDIHVSANILCDFITTLSFMKIPPNEEEHEMFWRDRCHVYTIRRTSNQDMCVGVTFDKHADLYSEMFLKRYSRKKV